MEYEIRQVDALNDGTGWYWNTSYHIGDFKTKSQDHKRAFLNALHRMDIFEIKAFKRKAYYVDYDGSVFELRLKSSDEPLFAAIPKE